MIPQGVTNVLYAYATMGRIPRDDTWTALETAVVRAIPDMNAQDVSNLMWAGGGAAIKSSVVHHHSRTAF